MSLGYPEGSRKLRILNSKRKRARVLASVRFVLFVAALGMARWFAGEWYSPGALPAIADALFAICLLLGGYLLTVRTRPAKIPVLNYHSVSARPGWLLNADTISLTPARFEEHLRYLKKHRYRTLFVSELHDILSDPDRQSRTGKYVALTFDDGYGDNWIAAFPLLKKYGMKGTFFVTTDFVEPREKVRPNLEDVWAGRSSASELAWEGYLTWREIREMEQSGFARIEAHGEQHTRVFVGNAVLGFNSPKHTNIWDLWNVDRHDKPFWWKQNRSCESLWGSPVYAQAHAMTHRAYLPDSALTVHLVEWVRQRGASFWNDRNWEAELRDEMKTYQAGHPDAGRWETEQEYRERVEMSLRNCRRILESRLGRKVGVLAWPEDEFNETAENIAVKCGYTVTVSNRHNTMNSRGDDAAKITRVFTGSRIFGVDNAALDKFGFVLAIKIFEGYYCLYPFLVAAGIIRKIVCGGSAHSVGTMGDVPAPDHMSISNCRDNT